MVLKKQFTNALDRLRLLFEEQITVMTLAENLEVFSKENFLSEMQERRFHTAVFFEDQKWWRFDIGELEPVPVGPEDLLEASTPILTAFRGLLKKRRFFIKDESGELAFIITRTDLDKIPMRICIFGMISTFETFLKELVRASINDWQESLSQNRLHQAEKLFAWKMERGEDIDLIQCLQFGDLGSIFSKKQRFKNFEPGFSRDDWVDMMNAIGKLRDALAHSQLNLGFTWEEIDGIILFIRRIIDKGDIDFVK